MEVADEVDDEAQRELLVGKARARILERAPEAAERLERVAFGRGMIVGDPVERDVMPRSRGLLPERLRGRAHVVGPVRGLVEALGTAEKLANVRPRQPGQLRIGDRGHDPVAGLAPGQSG